MKLILHIGMGKTGTSSIQNVLRTSSAELAEQNVQYLGMWFDAIDPRFNGSLGTREFFALDEEAMQSAATLFLENLNRINAERGIETFVLSNEAIFGAVHRIKPFILALCEQIDVKIVIYIRDPHSWLPSAYTQWSLYHKSVKGPLRSFSEHAPELLSMYQNIEHWLNDFSDHIIARPHISSENVVISFGQACDIRMLKSQKRVLDRSEPAEILLRAAFNARYEAEVFPDRFDNVVIRTNRKIPTLDSLFKTCFQHDGIKEIIDDRAELFESIKNMLGTEFDFMSNKAETKSMPDAADLQQRLLDYLVEITLSQAERIKRLENQMQELTKEK